MLSCYASVSFILREIIIFHLDNMLELPIEKKQSHLDACIWKFYFQFTFISLCLTFSFRMAEKDDIFHDIVMSEER